MALELSLIGLFVEGYQRFGGRCGRYRFGRICVALLAPVLAAGPPHAAKNVDAAANKINRSVFFITILPGHYSISKNKSPRGFEQKPSERWLWPKSEFISPQGGRTKVAQQFTAGKKRPKGV